MAAERQGPGGHRLRLRDIIDSALDQAVLAVDIPASALDSMVDAVGKIPHPGVEEVTGIVLKGLETAGEGAKEAAEHAGEIAGAIVEAISDINV